MLTCFSESSSSSDKQDIECQSSAACASLSHKSGTEIESAEGATCGVDPNNTSEEGEKCKQSVGADSVSGGVSLVDSISAALQAKFHGHWYPSVPSKVRCCCSSPRSVFPNNCKRCSFNSYKVISHSRFRSKLTKFSPIRALHFYCLHAELISSYWFGIVNIFVLTKMFFFIAISKYV